MAIISLNAVTKVFGRFAALREVSADFEPGKLFVILGENGAGKSTLLRAIAGLARPTTGDIRIQGATYEQDASALRRKIGYMAHASMLYDELTAMENLRYTAALYGMSEEAKLRASLQQMGIDPTLGRHVSEFSQGMKQRVSLARAILHEPEILLLDEPFSNLDVGGAGEMSQLLARLRDQGKTILVVTHQLAYVEAIADEQLTLTHGEIVSRTSSPARQEVAR